MKCSVGLFIIGAALAQGSTILLQSGVSAGEFNNITATNVVLPTLEPNWEPNQSDGASWISFENTGWQVIGGVGSAVNTLSNATGVGSPSARFFQPFTDNNGTGLSGTVSVWADDTAAVYLDGNLLVSANLLQGPLNCSPAVTCTGPGTVITFNTTPGEHTIEFDVYQTGGWTYGLLYDGTVTDNVASTPEPGTYILFGAGLIALALARLKRVF